MSIDDSLSCTLTHVLTWLLTMVSFPPDHRRLRCSFSKIADRGHVGKMCPDWRSARLLSIAELDTVYVLWSLEEIRG